MWDIGHQWARFLESQGVSTALEFSRQPDSWVRTHLNVIGLRTAIELRGTPCIPLEQAPPPRKGIVVSRMFDKRLTELETIPQALIAYVTRAGEKLRRGGLAARHLTVLLHNSPFATDEAYYSNGAGLQLAFPTSDTAELIRHATANLERLYRPGFRYTKCGVMLAELVPQGCGLRDLFDGRDESRSRRLMSAIDTVNRRMGRETVFYAGSGIRRDRKAFADMKTQSFTTDWHQLLCIRLRRRHVAGNSLTTL